MPRKLSLAEVTFQGTGGTLDSEDDSSEEEDCGLNAYLGEPSCKRGTLDKLITPVETAETQVD